jgi:hypothetical protein
MSTSSYQSKFAFLALAVGIVLVGGLTVASTEARARPAEAVTRPSKAVAQAASTCYHRILRGGSVWLPCYHVK